MKTSAKGIEFLERHEGVVLKAYRDPVGIWTIGAGLTAATGLITPRHGMTITKERASALLAEALRGNYEPAVADQMPRVKQYEFDAAVSFHFNTGAIKRASWVKAWRDGQWSEVSKRLALWKKGGGKVLPGLVRRRAEEFALLRDGEYGAPVTTRIVDVRLARFALPLSSAEIGEVRAAFAALGYDPGDDVRGVSVFAVTRFQGDHDLTVDAIVGRATLSTLQRRVDAASKAKLTAVTATGGAAGTGVGGVAEALSNEQLLASGALVAAAGLAVGLWLAWRYRDVVAAKIQKRLPRLARTLRGL